MKIDPLSDLKNEVKIINMDLKVAVWINSDRGGCPDKPSTIT
ncbi:MAG: hypothetical protein ACP5IZ_03515 [Thermoprotei archaeon]